jgi:membrane protease YdiL (CAAX protease family)
MFFYWKYTRGAWWPRSTALSRFQNSRANDLSGDVWAAAIGAGILGQWSILLFQNVYSRLVTLPQQSTEELNGIPVFSLTIFLIMSAIVAGVVEESAFRGHLQAPLERRYGPVAAILITGLVFSFAHFTHKEVTFVLIPWYLGVAIVYGTIAYMTNSILPGLVLHAGGNIFSGLTAIAAGRSERQLSKKAPPLIWESGPDSMFWVSVFVFILVAGAATAAYIGLKRLSKPGKFNT